MAPPNIYPQGMTLHSIGYAALKYPLLPPTLPIPLGNQIGVLQRIPGSSQNHAVAQIASQYLSALLTYQTSSAPTLHDPNDAQYYVSTSLVLLNFLTSNPDVCIRIAKVPAITHTIIDRLLDPDLEKNMRSVTRMGGATFEADLGTLLQFVSTMLLYPDHSTEPPHPRIAELIPILKGWKKKYSGNFISKVSARLIPQIEGPTHPSTLAAMREQQGESLVCGVEGCGVRTGLDACARCKIQRYCGQEHQRRDWKWHKHICDKGLVEEGAEGVD